MTASKHDIAAIEYLDYYLPSNSIDIERFVCNLDYDSVPAGLSGKQEYLQYLREVMKAQSIRIARDDDTSMLHHLLENMFSTHAISPKEIDAIIFTQERFNHKSENLGQYCQYCFGMQNATVLNLSGNHCCNFEMALKLCKSLLFSDNGVDNILVVSAQKLNGLDKRVIGKVAVLGDGAGVALVRKNCGGIAIRDVNFFNDGYFHDLKIDQNCTLLHYRNSVGLISRILKNNDLSSDSIKTVIAQNINPSLYLKYFERFDLDGKVFAENIGKYGHLTCVDMIQNLKDSMSTGAMAKNDLVLTFGMGWAGSYASCLLEV